MSRRQRQNAHESAIRSSRAFPKTTAAGQAPSAFDLASDWIQLLWSDAKAGSLERRSHYTSRWGHRRQDVESARDEFVLCALRGFDDFELEIENHLCDFSRLTNQGIQIERSQTRHGGGRSCESVHGVKGRSRSQGCYKGQPIMLVDGEALHELALSQQKTTGKTHFMMKAGTGCALSQGARLSG